MDIVDCAKPGSRTTGFIETNTYCDGVRVAIPCIVIRGAGDGPVMTVLACQHGREAMPESSIVDAGERVALVKACRRIEGNRS